MQNNTIIWTRHQKSSNEVVYTSDRRCEFSIYNENKRWILNYVDFWNPIDYDSVFVNIKHHSEEEMFAVPVLKDLAQKAYEDFLSKKDLLKFDETIN